MIYTIYKNDELEGIFDSLHEIADYFETDIKTVQRLLTEDYIKVPDELQDILIKIDTSSLN